MRLSRTVPITGSRVALGPFPFQVRSVTLVNQCQAGNLFVQEDNGQTYQATPATSETWSTGPTVQLTAWIDTPQTQGALTVVISDKEPTDAVSSSQLSTLAAIGSNVQRVTALPTTPFDGQVISLLIDPTQNTWPGVEWLLIFNTATGYWDFLGGSSLFNEITTNETTTSGSFTDLTTVGPSITVPFAGDYIFQYGAGVESQASLAGNAQIGIFATGSGIISANALASFFGAESAGWFLNAATQIKLTGLAAGVLWKLQYLISNSVAVSFFGRYLRITPVRIHS